MDQANFTWQKRNNSLVLYCDRRIAGRVVPDGKFAGMWRAKLPGGLSDMVNLSRAKDASLAHAEAAESRKNIKQNQGALSAISPPIGFSMQA